MDHKIYFVVPYFGEFPNYFQLWLDSCGRNKEFNWLLLTDCSINQLNIPRNVIVEKLTLKDIENIIQTNLDFKITLNSPYKLCDFRPIYWMILDHYKFDYNFWGYCDIDLIFGRLSLFITEDLLIKYDRIYSEGHLSLMSSSPISKFAFVLDGSKLNWIKVYQDEKNIGFDEHHGVNRIWNNQNLPFYKNTSEILDIDPQFKLFSLTHLPSNQKNQFFYVDTGRVLQGYFKSNKRIIVKEFAYIHIQKRKMPVNFKGFTKDSFMIDHKGFRDINLLPKCKKDLDFAKSKINNSLLLKKNKIKRIVRFYKNKIIYGI